MYANEFIIFQTPLLRSYREHSGPTQYLKWADVGLAVYNQVLGLFVNIKMKKKYLWVNTSYKSYKSYKS